MQLESIEDIAVVRLDAGKANAMNPAFFAGFSRLLDQLEASTRAAVVIVGAANAFSAGLDLPSLLPLDRDTMRSFIGLFEATMLRVFQIPRPVVAAVNGHAIAGGCVLALQADVRIAAAGTLLVVARLQPGFRHVDGLVLDDRSDGSCDETISGLVHVGEENLA